MYAIAEDCTEEPTTPTNTVSPAVTDLVTNGSMTSRGSSVSGEDLSGLASTLGSNGSYQSNSMRSTRPVDNSRQRRTGVQMVKSPISPQVMSASSEKKVCYIGSGSGGDSRRASEDKSVDDKNRLHQLLMSQPPPATVKQAPALVPLTTAATTQPHVLLGMLQAPVYNTLTTISPQTVISSEYISSSNNYHMVTTVPTLTSSTTSALSYGQRPLDASILLQTQITTNNKFLSQILEHFGIPFQYQNNVFSVDHLGVRFQIFVTNKIQAQYIGGDTMQYESLCTKLFSRLAPFVQ